MAVNLPPTGGGNQIFIDVIFRTFTEGLRQAGQAVQRAGTEPLAQFARGQASAAQGQEKLQQAFRASMENLRAWESLVGRSDRTLGAFVSTTEQFVRRRGLQLAPEQQQVFQNQRQQLQLMRESAAAFRDETREITANATARARFGERLAGVQRLRAAGVPTIVTEPTERRVLRAGVERGFADPEQIQRLRSLEQEAGRARFAIRLLGEEIPLGRTIAWAAAFTIVYNALRILTTLIASVTIGAVQRLADFQQRQIALAAEIVNIDPTIPFDRAIRGAGNLLEALVQLQPGFFGTRQQLQEIATATLRYFGEIDIQSERGRRNFLAFANGIALAQIGINRAGSSFREVAALIEGVIRPGAQFLTLLAKIDPKIEEHIQLWRREGTVIENIAKLIPGFGQAAAAVGDTILGQINRIESNIDRILRRTAQGGLVSLVLRGVGAVTADPGAAVAVIEIVFGAVAALAVSRFGPRIMQSLFRGMVATAAPTGAAAGMVQAIFGAVVSLAGIVGGRIMQSAFGGILAAAAAAGARIAAPLFGPLIAATAAVGGRIVQALFAGMAAGAANRAAALIVAGIIGATLASVLEPIIVPRIAELFTGGTLIDRLRRFVRPPEITEPPLLRRTIQSEELIIRGALAGLARNAEEQFENLQARFRRGEASLREFREAFQARLDALRSAIGQAPDVEAQEAAAKKFTAVLRERAQVEFEINEELTRRRTLRDIEAQERELQITLAATDSLFNQARVLRDLTEVRERRAEISRIEALRARAADVSPEIAAQKGEQARRDAEAVRQSVQDEVRAGQERQRAQEQTQIEILRIGQRAFAARILEIEQQARDELRRVEGNRSATLAVEERFLRLRIQVLKDALDAMRQAEAQAARDRTDLVIRPVEFRRAVGDFQAFFLQQAPTEETLNQLRTRFGRLREIQESGFSQQIQAIEMLLEQVPRTVEAAPLRLQLQTQLRDLIVQQAQAQFQLNQQERDALRIARDRNLDEEVRILERRLNTLVRIGAPMARIAEVQRQIGRAQQLRELRQFGRRELEEEQRNVELLLRAPGVGPEERRDLLERLDIVREAASQVAEEQQGAVQANQQTINRLNAIGQQVQATLKLISDESTNSARKAREEYEGLFTWLEGRLTLLVDSFRRAGGLTGRAFADAFTEHFGRAFPRPDGPAPAPFLRGIGGGATPERPAPAGAGPRGELPAPAPFLGGIGGGVAPERLPAPTGFGGPINVNLISSGPPQAPVIMIGNVDITDRVSQATIDEMVAAVLGPSGDAGVRRDRRQIPDGAVA